MVRMQHTDKKLYFKWCIYICIYIYMRQKCALILAQFLYRSVIGWREIIVQMWLTDQREIIVAIGLVGHQFSLFTNRQCLCLCEAYTYNLEIFLLQGTALPVLFPIDVIKCVRDSVILCIKSVCRLHEIAVCVCVHVCTPHWQGLLHLMRGYGAFVSVLFMFDLPCRENLLFCLIYGTHF